MLYNNINNVFYIPRTILAQSLFQTYNAKVFNLGIKLTYKYTVSKMSVNVWNNFISKRDLIKVE